MSNNDSPALLPSGRPSINLRSLFAKRVHPDKGQNECVCISLAEPQPESHEALVNGLQKILPFIYRTREQAHEILDRYGMRLPKEIPIPTAFNFQWSHTGEILVCAYFEECEDTVVLTYKWRLNTANNQNPFGMDVLAFDFKTKPPRIYAVAVKTTDPGDKDKTPSVVFKALSELKDYLTTEKLDDDLELISAHLQTDDYHRQIFQAWYNPYSQKVPANKPCLIAVPAIVTEGDGWDDRYAKPAINYRFGVPGAVRIICIKDLDRLVRLTYSRGER